MHVRRSVLFVALASWAMSLCAAEQLLPAPLASPDGKRAANVEWESLSQVGALRMLLYGADKRLAGSVEVPEVRPDPGDLTWLDNRWVMCESFLGERASAFFYVDAQERRGYLLEIYAVRARAPWEFDVAYSDPRTSFTVGNAAVGRTCLFPIVLGAVPVAEEDYFSLAFCQKFTAAVDSFREWKKAHGWTNFDVVGEPAIRSGTGGLVVCLIDNVPKLVYFHLSGQSPRDVLQTARLYELPPEAQNVVRRERDNIAAEWGDGGRYTLRLRATASGGAGAPPITTGTIADASDEPVTLALDTQLTATAAQRYTAASDEGEEAGDAVEKNRQQSGKSGPPAKKALIRRSPKRSRH
jgi:hypothetical protein